MKGFKDNDFKAHSQPLSSFSESYGLEADDDEGEEEEDGEDEDEDEDGEEGSDVEMTDHGSEDEK